MRKTIETIASIAKFSLWLGILVMMFALERQPIGTGLPTAMFFNYWILAAGFIGGGILGYVVSFSPGKFVQ